MDWRLSSYTRLRQAALTLGDVLLEHLLRLIGFEGDPKVRGGHGFRDDPNACCRFSGILRMPKEVRRRYASVRCSRGIFDDAPEVVITHRMFAVPDHLVAQSPELATPRFVVALATCEGCCELGGAGARLTRFDRFSHARDEANGFIHVQVDVFARKRQADATHPAHLYAPDFVERDPTPIAALRDEDSVRSDVDERAAPSHQNRNKRDARAEDGHVEQRRKRSHPGVQTRDERDGADHDHEQSGVGKGVSRPEACACPWPGTVVPERANQVLPGVLARDLDVDAQAGLGFHAYDEECAQ
ncbi:MAG TPA: hypothetical protein VM925_12870 [Labilithrix sp.]|nr:hypothetical protein [Labilithrix sp.]